MPAFKGRHFEDELFEGNRAEQPIRERIKPKILETSN